MEALEKWVIERRREFHRYPEIAFREEKTAGKVAAILNELSLEVKTGFAGTGVTALLRGKEGGKTLGLRADMDALPIEEKNEVEYRSEVPGVMHACGHDAHTAVLLGVAKHIVDNELQKNIKGNIKFIFQPAEEGVRGARAIIKEGVLENPSVDAVYACHVSNDLPSGEIGLYEHISNASSDRFNLTARAKGGHAAYPEKTSDAILASCFFVTQIQSIVSRNIDPTESAVVSVGVLEGGTASNILPDEVSLHGTVRAFSETTRLLARRRLRDFAYALKQSFALEGVDFEYVDGCPPCKNDPEAVSLVRSAAEEIVGEDRTKFLRPKMGAEDFAYFAEKKPAAFFRLGTGNKETGITGGGHQPYFEIDEGALITGVRVFLRAAEKYLGTAC